MTERLMAQSQVDCPDSEFLLLCIASLQVDESDNLGPTLGSAFFYVERSLRKNPATSAADYRSLQSLLTRPTMFRNAASYFFFPVGYDVRAINRSVSQGSSGFWRR